MKSKIANKTNLFVHFLGESMARQFGYGFISPLSALLFRGPVFNSGSTRISWPRFTFFIESTWKDAIWSGLKFLEAQINQEMICKGEMKNTQSNSAWTSLLACAGMQEEMNLRILEVLINNYQGRWRHRFLFCKIQAKPMPWGPCQPWQSWLLPYVVQVLSCLFLF